MEHAKRLLEQSASLTEAAYDTGLSGTSRLHDLFINIESMTPGEFKNKGRNLTITYSFYESPFGKILVASTPKGICHIEFVDDERRSLKSLQALYGNATIIRKRDQMHKNVLSVFQNDLADLSGIKLHVAGTPFQLKVWEALLKIPFGHLTTYLQVADSIGHPAAARAVGSAIAHNPVAFLIPCHRVIRSSGVIGDYHWGSARKAAIVGWEAARAFGGD